MVVSVDATAPPPAYPAEHSSAASNPASPTADAGHEQPLRRAHRRITDDAEYQQAGRASRCSAHRRMVEFPDGSAASRHRRRMRTAGRHPATTAPAIASGHGPRQHGPGQREQLATRSRSRPGSGHGGPDTAMSNNPTTSTTAATARPQRRVAALPHDRPVRRAPLAIISTMSSYANSGQSSAGRATRLQQLSVADVLNGQVAGGFEQGAGSPPQHPAALLFADVREVRPRHAATGAAAARRPARCRVTRRRSAASA